jgi:hypothetical protein
MVGRRVLAGFCIVGLCLLAGAARAQAQSSSVNIGFQFVAAGKTMAAGSYTVDINSNNNVVLTPAGGGAAVEVPRTRTLNKRNIARPELVFDVVGSAKFLAQVWLPGKNGCEVGRQGEALEQQTVKGAK